MGKSTENAFFPNYSPDDEDKNKIDELSRQVSVLQDSNNQLQSQVQQSVDAQAAAKELTGFSREEIGQKSKSASDMFAENLYRSGVDSQVAGYKANQALRQQIGRAHV